MGALVAIAMLGAAPPTTASLLHLEHRLDELCRGPGQEIDGPVCRKRDAAVRRLERRGWCWGPDDAEIEASRHWMRQGTRCRRHIER